ncbi:unnamed protein product [Didymodactylos carnosus]|uniref:Uncharacterized protein n=1 Tax=Didymodactylos carnosus TaxID=1234261 RepID=A0A8S2E395_9BILA|nr:unnamed protein product [Didymodactylos carnosus]CAF3833621.1 unnamed protein product [Didymodactylos carnosus]
MINDLGLDLVDDESVEDHVLRIINNGEYTSVLTLTALSSVFHRPVRSVYPNVNGDVSGEKDGYYTLLNRTFEPREDSQNSSAVEFMWSGSKPKRDRIWRGNHFVPLLSTHQQQMNTQSGMDFSTPFSYEQHQQPSSHEKMRSNINFNENEQELLPTPAIPTNFLEQEENDENKPDRAAFLSRQIFFDAANVIQQVISVSFQ